MKRVLLDTHALIWMALGDSRLSPRLAAQIQAAEEIAVSMASLWEIAIKTGLGRLDLDISMEDFVTLELPRFRVNVLSVEPEDIVEYSKLPLPPNGHRDPFDRMLVVQAIRRQIPLASADHSLDQYSGLTRFRL